MIIRSLTLVRSDHLGAQGRTIGCNDGITKPRTDVHGIFPSGSDSRFIEEYRKGFMQILNCSEFAHCRFEARSSCK